MVYTKSNHVTIMVRESLEQNAALNFKTQRKSASKVLNTSIIIFLNFQKEKDNEICILIHADITICQSLAMPLAIVKKTMPDT